MKTKDRVNTKDTIRKYKEKKPWYKHYNNAYTRCCCKSGKYGKRGIKFLMKLSDFEFLWFRDSAYKMERPSIDRIDPRGNYETSNCRFIELRKNWEGIHSNGRALVSTDVKTRKKEYFSSSYQAFKKFGFLCCVLARALKRERSYAYGRIWRYV